MLWLQMSRDEDVGGEEWDFKRCVWTPTRRRDGRRWAYWDTIFRIESGDVVVHLRGTGVDAHFVGFSVASSNGFVTEARPPQPGPWGYASRFYKAMLKDFTAFATPLQLASVMQSRQAALRAYYARNRARPPEERRLLFYVIQSGKLQCLNGAYLTEVDDELARLILDASLLRGGHQAPSSVIDEVDTQAQLETLRRRVRQKAFSDAVRENFEFRCAFPECDVAERAFLVGGHIARWTVDEARRHGVENGLALCLMHQRAFDLGLFTLDDDYRVFSLPERLSQSAWAEQHIAPFLGQPLRTGARLPARGALARQRERVGLPLPAGPDPASG